jgi:hypothetical protein
MRHKLLPDKRLNWRDKNMPVYKVLGDKAIEITPEERQRIAKMKMESDLPNWTDDPTYDMKGKKK